MSRHGAFSLALLLLAAGGLPAQPPGELKGHTALVYSVAFSPDGKLLATGSFDNSIKLWDFAAGKEARTLTGHTAPVYCVAFSPDGSTLASSGLDKTIKLWNVADGKFLRDLTGHTDIVDSVAWSPDGKLLASGAGNADKSVRLWDPAAGKETKNLGTHGNAVYGVAFSPDGKLLASAGADGAVKIWDVAGGKEVKSIKEGEMLVPSALLLPAANAAAQALKSPLPPQPVTGVVFTPDNASVVSIGFDRLLHVWNVGTGAETLKLGPTPDDLYGIALSRDGKLLATSGYGGHLTIWDLAQGKAIQTKKVKFGAYCVAFTPDGKALVTGHDGAMCLITPLETFDPVK
jgi:WD40 repeat protein